MVQILSILFLQLSNCTASAFTFIVGRYNLFKSPEATTVLRDEERNSLEDVLFNEVESPSLEEQKFLVALRLSPVPEQLVKGYEFQMLNK